VKGVDEIPGCKRFTVPIGRGESNLKKNKNGPKKIGEGRGRGKGGSGESESDRGMKRGENLSDNAGVVLRGNWGSIAIFGGGGGSGSMGQGCAPKKKGK